MASEADSGGAESPGAAGPDETEAWAEVERAWADEERHRAYLARFVDLEGLAVAGGRYRAALAERPGDEIALRFRDEVLRRATTLGLVSPPQAEASRARAPRALRLVAVALALVFAAVAALGALRLLSAAGGAP